MNKTIDEKIKEKEKLIEKALINYILPEKKYVSEKDSCEGRNYVSDWKQWNQWDNWSDWAKWTDWGKWNNIV